MMLQTDTQYEGSIQNMIFDVEEEKIVLVQISIS